MIKSPVYNKFKIALSKQMIDIHELDMSEVNTLEKYLK
jgi:hypothetical protein